MHPISAKQSALHLLAAAVTLLVVGCGSEKHDSAWWEGENERIALQHELELKTFRFEQVYSTDFTELEALRKSNGSSAAALEQLRRQKTDLTVAVASLEDQREEVRRTAIGEQRQRAMDKTFDEMTLASGRSFRKVSVSSIDDAGVTIRHADGSAKLRYEDLSAVQRVFFGLDEEFSAAAEDREEQDAIAYERWIDSRLLVMKEKESAASERREEIAQRNAQASSAMSRNLVAANTSPLAQPSRSAGYSTYRAYRPTYRYVYYSAPRYRYNYCRPRVSIQSGRVVGTRHSYRPTVSPKKSFANTALKNIP